ncbi:hypothetical protein EDC56_0753 [Sinobacterium caligoides]|uniref:Uncharacterized protein n=1 Tax=Sinobacterium caligoides TaxID=933926 RepID=A0A3N2DZB6_9GAMM|nr:hypothetical protein [Sinobacterium caligoides]ROS05223.1 hypothetical protein EDC56_0753 [Sinobacterium caligoides]
MFGNSSAEVNTFDITEVGHIERIVVGTTTPDKMPTDEDNKKKMAQINRCLTDFPKGRIIGMERSFSVIRIGEHQVVLEAVVYHLGFKKKPLWMDEEEKAKPQYGVDEEKVSQVIANL